MSTKNDRGNQRNLAGDGYDNIDLNTSVSSNLNIPK